MRNRHAERRTRQREQIINRDGFVLRLDGCWAVAVGPAYHGDPVTLPWLAGVRRIGTLDENGAGFVPHPGANTVACEHCGSMCWERPDADRLTPRPGVPDVTLICHECLQRIAGNKTVHSGGE